MDLLSDVLTTRLVDPRRSLGCDRNISTDLVGGSGKDGGVAVVAWFTRGDRGTRSGGKRPEFGQFCFRLFISIAWLRDVSDFRCQSICRDLANRDTGRGIPGDDGLQHLFEPQTHDSYGRRLLRSARGGAGQSVCAYARDRPIHGRVVVSCGGTTISQIAAACCIRKIEIGAG
ncbi:MAG: hypothetical protein JWO45_1577 [Spartobacteria bacterium]|nr:hypothetical protein [Spartobacteria bacterium]